jgi:hypothetical protein
MTSKYLLFGKSSVRNIWLIENKVVLLHRKKMNEDGKEKPTQ